MLLKGRKLFLCFVAACLFSGFVITCAAQEQTDAPAASGKTKLHDAEHMRKQLKQLTAENEHLRARVAELEKVLDGQAIQDRLMQEEQRVENLQGQLMVLAEKEAELQSHLDNVTEQLRPEYLNQLQVLGSLRPEEVRESTRRRLAKEQRHVETQLELLHQNKARLQSSISMADLQIQNLRLKMQTVLHP